MGMPIGNDYKDKYAMFGSMTMGMGNNGIGAPKGNETTIDFGQTSVEGIGGQSEAAKAAGASANAGANLGFVDRLNRIDQQNKLDHPEVKSTVEGFDTDLGKELDLMA